MISPELCLPVYADCKFYYFGLDSPDKCLDKKHFANYPYTISYEYNSKGYRDAEWPETLSDLKESVWCFGDSYTFGLGSPKEHTWPSILEKEINTRCINISMDGASNEWISRKAIKVMELIQPKKIVIQWSFVHRTEHDNCLLPDHKRRIHINKGESIPDMYSRFYRLVNRVKDIGVAYNIKQSHSIVPLGVADETFPIDPLTLNNLWDKIRGDEWPKSFPDTCENMQPVIITELGTILKMSEKKLFKFWPELAKLQKFCSYENGFVDYEVLDVARDGHHYDKLTSTSLVKKITERL